MSILKVARMGHPVLSRAARPVEPAELASAKVQRLIDDMLTTMHEVRGVGLAAPQVHESLRLFVMDPGEDESDEPRVVVNPELSFPDDRTMRLWEGCLSIPGIRGLTERRRAVEVTCLDRDGREQGLVLEGYPAAIVQHETDHLDGRLFLERMPDLSRITFEDEFHRFHGGDTAPDPESA